MPEPFEDDYDFADSIAAERTYRAQRRQKMISCLDDVAAEADIALRDAGLSMPLFFSVPSLGGALATFATPGDPCDEDWSRASEIIALIVGNMLGIAGLRTNSLPCIASGLQVGAADILPADNDCRPEAEPIS
jgi:hypothetical protein